MLRLPVEVKGLVEFSRILIVLFLSLVKQILLFLHYCFTVSQFAHMEVNQM